MSSTSNEIDIPRATVGVASSASLNTIGAFALASKSLAVENLSALTKKINAARIRYGLKDVELVLATRRRDVITAKALLSAGVNPRADKAVKNGWSPLLLAAAEGDIAMIHLFAQHVAAHPQDDVIFKSAEHDNYQTALQVALEKRHYHAANEIIVTGMSNILSMDRHGLTAVDVMVYDGQVGLVDSVGKIYGFEVLDNDSQGSVRLPVAFHAINGQAESRFSMLEYLQGHGTPLASACDKDQNTLLHTAVRMNNIVDVKFVLSQADVDVDAMNHVGMTPLHLAAHSGSADIVTALLKAGAAPNAVSVHSYERSLTGVTPLMFASAGGHQQAAKLLIEHPATNLNIEVEDSRETALKIAAKNGYVTIAEMIEGEMRRRIKAIAPFSKSFVAAELLSKKQSRTLSSAPR
jgi:ankyrin repeat protein